MIEICLGNNSWGWQVWGRMLPFIFIPWGKAEGGWAPRQRGCLDLSFNQKLAIVIRGVASWHPPSTPNYCHYNGSTIPIWVFEGTFILCYNVRTGKVQPFAYDHTENLTSLNQGHPSSTVSLLWLFWCVLLGHLLSLLFSPPKCTLGKGMKHLLHIILSENPSSFFDLKDNGRCVLLGNLTWTGCWHSCFWFIQKVTVDDEERTGRMALIKIIYDSLLTLCFSL